MGLKSLIAIYIMLITPENNYFVYPSSFLSVISLSISLNREISYISDFMAKMYSKDQFYKDSMDF